MSPVPVPGAVERAPEVRAMFDQLAPTYDRANRVISLGLDQGWRRRAIGELGRTVRGDVVDLCAGTLDLSLMLLRAGARTVRAVDFSAAMLEAGRPKLPAGAPVMLITADARQMPLLSGSASGIIAGFGLRNVPEVERAVAECARVLRPGGRLVVLDFFRPETALSRLLQGSYNRFVMPILGGFVSGFGDAYRYLAGSIDAFASQGEFEAMMRQAGFVEVRGRRMFPPVASIVSGTREEAP